MTRDRVPSRALWLLERFVPGNEPLIGDLEEEFDRRRSRVWLWVEVIVAITISRMSRESSDEIRPLRLVDVPPVEAIERSRRVSTTFHPINLSASPLSSAGGLGLAALMLWLAREEPDAWWVVLASVAAGALLGIVLILRNRARDGLPERIALGIGATVVMLAMCANLTAAPQAFDVTSVKPNRGDGGRGAALQPGRFSQTGVTLRQLIQMAYGTTQIAGGPGWLETDRFDVEGRGDFSLAGFLPGADGSPPLVYAMLRQLLEDRFKVATHTEMQDRQVYALVVARKNRELGPRLHASATDCDALLAAAVQRGRPPAPPARGEGGPPCSVSVRPGLLHGDSIPMSRLAGALTASADRPVIDRTGLSGVFNVDLEWTPGLAAQGSADAGAAAAPTGVALFTALREQLGLELDPTTAPIQILIVDRADHPTPD